MLSRRKMQRNESVQEYSLIMKELASRGNIEMDAVIQYIVDGIPDEVDRKIILYEATTWEELKQKLDIYSRVKSKVSQRMAAASPPQKPSHRAADCRKPKRERGSCYGCGSVEHR
nr:PREDICTED: uncharacterized protein LOC107398740 [Tribolium castaneum]|eukprot:XP_015839409.1 PREDICTED: uncharacterized protein LOC107398740 [Tribolium castaneum]